MSIARLSLASVCALAGLAAADPSFRIIQGPTATENTELLGLSANGGVAVGKMSTMEGTLAIRWTAEDGLTPLGDFEGGRLSSAALGISADGSTIVGYGTPGAESPLISVPHPFRWTQASGMVDLLTAPLPAPKPPTARALATSGDGSVVIGNTGVGFIWDAADGIRVFNPKATVADISADGSIIVGELSTDAGWVPARFVNSVAEALAEPSVTRHYQPAAVSADGSTVVGVIGVSEAGFPYPPAEAFRWTVEQGLVSLGDLPGGYVLSQALDASRDGSVVVGQANTALGSTAFIWDSLHGMRSLQEALEGEYGLDLGDWTLASANAISQDGLVIAGLASGPHGPHRGFIAQLPEPACLGMALAAGLLIARRTHR